VKLVISVKKPPAIHALTGGFSTTSDLRVAGAYFTDITYFTDV
jgi:hypothetical protein